MSNIISFLHKYGSIPFSQMPFCDVDNLVLSYLAYAELDGIVPSPNENSSVTVYEATDTYIAGQYDGSNAAPGAEKDRILALLKGMAFGARYQDARLSGYVSEYDAVHKKQFAALTIELADGTLFVAFRGTDNNLASWQEDFNMSFETTPAQAESVRYLENTMQRCGGMFRVGGHSKGGHLSVYACTMCEDRLKARLLTVYSNDGPGLDQDLINSNAYSLIRSKVVHIIPAHGVLGMLFEHDAQVRIVKSSNEGFNQHDCISWMVEGMDFVEVKKLEAKAIFLNKVFSGWLDRVPLAQRKVFVESLFDTFSECGMETFADVRNAGTMKIAKILVMMQPRAKEVRQTTTALVGSFASTIASDTFSLIGQAA